MTITGSQGSFELVPEQPEEIYEEGTAYPSDRCMFSQYNDGFYFDRTRVSWVQHGYIVAG